MDKKVLAILLIFIAGSSFLTLGCAGKKNAGATGPTITPTATLVASMAPAAQASNVSALTPAATAPTTAPVQSNASSGGPNLAPSLADISGEDNDLTGFPETGLPTPTLD